MLAFFLSCLPARPACLLRRRHENVIAVRDIMRPASQDYNDVYIVYELMDTDLHQVGKPLAGQALAGLV